MPHFDQEGLPVYRTNEQGERVVGGTRRADGSIRPERKLREGYIPLDEQPRYTSKGQKV
jgi:hypothetical protein